MLIKGTDARYSRVAIAFHWAAAAAISASLFLGFAAAYASEPNWKLDLLRLHVVAGAATVLLTAVRAVWGLVDQRPASVDGQPSWQRHLACATHLLLYVIPILAGVSGIGLMILSKAAPVLFLGETGRPARFADFAPMTVHIMAACALMGLIGLHIAAVLFHQFYHRDRVLARMGLGTRHSQQPSIKRFTSQK